MEVHETTAIGKANKCNIEDDEALAEVRKIPLLVPRDAGEGGRREQALPLPFGWGSRGSKSALDRRTLTSFTNG